MGPLNQQQSRLLAEVSHQINSPLAAIRNALYLAAQRSDDPQLHAYLALANEEVTSIVSRMKDLREELEHGWVAETPWVLVCRVLCAQQGR